jgi:hypothetical protein
MRVLFLAAHYAYYRNFESVVLALAERGHSVHLAADERESLGGAALVERLAAGRPGITYGFAPSLDDEPWFLLARKLRSASDYVRFHDSAFAPFSKSRLTLRERIPRGVLRLMDAGVGGNPSGRRILQAMLRASERVMPVSEASRAFIEAQNPDVVLVASVTAWRLPQIDHLRAARALGRRTGRPTLIARIGASRAALRTAGCRLAPPAREGWPTWSRPPALTVSGSLVARFARRRGSVTAIFGWTAIVAARPRPCQFSR